MSIRRPKLRPIGFTLTEMLVVIGIVLLIAIVTVPVFRTMTGSRSTEAANNQLAALLGRVRSEAIGVQEIRGIAFFPDIESGRVQAVIVRQAQYPTMGLPAIPPDVYLDFVPDRDPVLMPVGVGVQVVDDCEIAAAGLATPTPLDDVRLNDAYIGFNTATVSTMEFTYGGVILFDGYGRVVSKSYGFKFFTQDAAGVKNGTTALAKSLNMTGTLNDFVPPVVPPATTGIRSQFGFVVYDQEAYTAQGTGDLKSLLEDPQLTTGLGAYNANQTATGISELTEEKWIDANAVPMLVNRNNGTLVKGL